MDSEMPIFMKAGSIKGDVVAESHRDWIWIESFEFGFEFAEDDVRKSVGAGAPEPDLSPFEVTKSNDISGPGLMKWMLDGEEIETVQIDVCGDAVFAGRWRCFLRYVLKNVVLTDCSVTMGDAEKGAAQLKLSMRYEEIGFEQISYDHRNAIRSRSKSAVHKRIS